MKKIVFPIPKMIQNLEFWQRRRSKFEEAKPTSKQRLCKHRCDADGSKVGDAGTAKSQILSLFRYILVIFGYFCLSILCEKATSGFTLNQITSEKCFNPKWEVQVLFPQQEIFTQKFIYLGSGGQSFAFLSEDGKYVLKFFKSYCRFPRTLVQNLPLFAHNSLKAKKKMEKDFNSYILAFEHLREESGLLYLHLNPTQNLLPKVTLIDKLGIEHPIFLDEKQFMLQKRAELTFDHLDALMKNHDLEGARQSLISLLNLLQIRQNLGIYDEDAKLHRNCGFIGNQAIFIDIGRFCKSTKQQTLEEMTQRLSLWLLDHYPELAEVLSHEIKNY